MVRLPADRHACKERGLPRMGESHDYKADLLSSVYVDINHELEKVFQSENIDCTSVLTCRQLLVEKELVLRCRIPALSLHCKSRSH